MGGFSFGIPLSFGGVTLTPDQIAAAVAAQTGQPAQTLTQAVTAASQPAAQPTTAVPANATGIAAQELTGDPDMDRQILAARDAQGVSVDVGAGSLTPEEYQQATEELGAWRNLPENRAYRDTRRPELAALASGLLSLAVPVVAPSLAASTGLAGALGAGAGSAVTGAALGGTLAAAQGDSIVEGVLTGGLSGGLSGLPLDANITNVLGGPTQAVIDTASAPLAAVSAAGPAVMDSERQDDDLAGLDLPVVDAVVGGVPVILDQPPTYVEPVVEPKEEEGGGGSAADGATAPTGGATAQADGEVQGGVSDAQTGAQAGSEATEGVDPIVANQIFEAILAETDQNVRDGLIADWQNYTGETFDNTLLPDYQEQAPPEPVGYVWGDGVWTPVFDIPPAGSVIFEPGAQQPDYTPQEDEVVDVTGDLIDAAGGLLDSTIDADTTADIEPVDTTTVEPVDTTTTEPVDTTTDGVESGTTGGDQSVDVDGEGTGDGAGVGAGSGEGEGDGEGDGNGTGTGMMAAAAAGAAFEPKWTELFKYTTLTPYQKKAIAPYVDYIAQARGMLS